MTKESQTTAVSFGCHCSFLNGASVMSGPFKRLFRLELGSRGVTRDIDSELAFHLDMRTREFIAAGMPAGEARRAAERSFGDRAAIASDLRGPRLERARERERTERLQG